jgi:hypothetical protein
LPAHKDLTGVDLHEPKGAAAASANTIYTSDGAGSGTWSKVTVNSIDATSIKNINERRLLIVLPDVSAASSVIVPVSETCALVSVYGMLNGAITVANSNLTVYKNGVTNLGTAVVAFAGSAKGDDYTISASANTLASGDYIEIASDGGSTTTMPMTFILVFAL